VFFIFYHFYVIVFNTFLLRSINQQDIAMIAEETSWTGVIDDLNKTKEQNNGYMIATEVCKGIIKMTLPARYAACRAIIEEIPVKK
jgi:hypothetical protein